MRDLTSGEEVAMSTSDPEPTDRGSADALAAFVRGPLADDYEHTRKLIEDINHHIRTPLTVILGHVDLWLSRDYDFPAELQESLAAVVRAGLRVRDVGVAICELIDVTSIHPDTTETVRVWEVVTAEAAAFRDRAAHRGIELLVDGDRTARCVANASRLQRALRELLDNALTYAPDRSRLGVVMTTADSWIRITVMDEGDGIEPADRERLVRPFERGTHARQPVDGLGMGLALASAVAASHGGRLILAGSSGGGLQVCLELPLDAGGGD
jgi:signal transduction histidine kinase